MLVSTLLTVLHIASCYGQPVVDTNLGPVQGTSVTLTNGNVIDSFLGIPYAAPPVGNLRFEPTQPATPWEGVFNATQLGATCMQTESNLWGTHPGWSNYAEDCLNLNIYSKQMPTDAEPSPVMVYIHGGAFSSGASISDPGYFLADNDVLVVIINYRLNIFGFATSEDAVVPGNMGLLDAIMALQFVRDNIEAFGGDPGRVTIFGQSAGGAAVGFLISSPLATSLFHQAILQSGTELSRRALHKSYTHPSNYFRDAAAEVGCPTADNQAMVDCMKGVDAEQLRDTSFNCTEGSPSCWGHEPVVDGTVIPEHPFYLHEQGNVNRVPEMIGLMSRDGFIFVPDEFEDGLTRDELDAEWRALVDWFSVLWPDPSRAEDVYQAQRWMYADWPYVDDPIRNRDMYGEWITDDYYGANPDLQAKFMCESQPVYFYVNNLTASYSSDHWKGAVHSDDNQFVFGWPLLWENPEALEHSGIGAEERPYTDLDRNNSRFMMTLWSNFAKYGNPTPSPVGPDEAHQIMWPLYVPGNYSYTWLDSTPYTGKDYRQKEYAYWAEYLRYLMWAEEFFNTEDS